MSKSYAPKNTLGWFIMGPPLALSITALVLVIIVNIPFGVLAYFLGGLKEIDKDDD